MAGHGRAWLVAGRAAGAWPVMASYMARHGRPMGRECEHLDAAAWSTKLGCHHKSNEEL